MVAFWKEMATKVTSPLQLLCYAAFGTRLC